MLWAYRLQQKAPMSDAGLPTASEMLVGLHGYWDSKRAGRLMPSRDEIDAAEIPQVMPSVMLCDVELGPLRFRYRLVGTRVTELVHRDVTGRYIDESAASPTWIAVKM